MVNRMVFFYVYVIAERFTSDFGESLLPVLFFPPQSPKNTPMIHDLIQDSQVESENNRKRSRHAPKGQRAHSPGHRPGYDETMSTPRRGKSISVQAFIETLLPFQGAIAAANLPRALPWAMRMLGLQPAP